ncbi:MAG: hypothetical protein AB1486_31060, partial [Planctomycetota bacterium]
RTGAKRTDGHVRCIRWMAGAERRTARGWQSAARWRGAKRPRHPAILLPWGPDRLPRNARPSGKRQAIQVACFWTGGGYAGGITD